MNCSVARDQSHRQPYSLSGWSQSPEDAAAAAAPAEVPVSVRLCLYPLGGLFFSCLRFCMSFGSLLCFVLVRCLVSKQPLIQSLKIISVL